MGDRCSRLKPAVREEAPSTGGGFPVSAGTLAAGHLDDRCLSRPQFSGLSESLHARVYGTAGPLTGGDSSLGGNFPNEGTARGSRPSRGLNGHPQAHGALFNSVQAGTTGSAATSTVKAKTRGTGSAKGTATVEAAITQTYSTTESARST